MTTSIIAEDPIVRPAAVLLGCLALIVFVFFVSMAGALALERTFAGLVQHHLAIMMSGCVVAVLLSIIGCRSYWRSMLERPAWLEFIALAFLLLLTYYAFLIMFGQAWGNAHDPELRRIVGAQTVPAETPGDVGDSNS